MLAAAVSILLVHTAVGMLVSAAIARSSAGPGFYRLSLLIALGCFALGFGMRFGPAAASMPALSWVSMAGYGVAAIATILFGVRMQPHQEPSFAFLTVAAISGLVGVLGDPAVLSGAAEISAAGRTLYRFGLWSAVFAVGSVVFAMLLAHWYLIEPRMSIVPLQRVLVLFGLTQIAILLSLVAIIAFHWNAWTTMDGGLVRAFALGNALFVFMRAFLGVLAPIGLVVMTWKTVEIRSIQSATGILYAAVVFILFGSTISIYLSLATGQPY